MNREDQDPLLDAAGIHQLFTELSEHLAARGQNAQLFVVGGAAMALAYDARRTTRDIDAAFEPSTVVREITAVIGRNHGLQNDWLNDAAKGFMPGNDESPRTVFASNSLLVQVPSPEYLLAMKIHSGRGQRDIDDAVHLYNIAGYTDAEQVIELLERTYPARLLLPRHQYVAQNVAEQAQATRRTHQIYSLALPSTRDQPDQTSARPEPPRDTPPHRSRGMTR